MLIFICVISLNHAGLLQSLGCLDELPNDLTIIAKSNARNEQLTFFCENNGNHYIDESYGLGFSQCMSVG